MQGARPTLLPCLIACSPAASMPVVFEAIGPASASTRLLMMLDAAPKPEWGTWRQRGEAAGIPVLVRDEGLGWDLALGMWSGEVAREGVEKRLLVVCGSLLLTHGAVR